MLDRLGAGPGYAATSARTPGTWEKVVRKLRVGAMPPQGMPRPDRAARIRWPPTLKRRSTAPLPPRPIPASPVLHRLNRTEYANAIRDLLDLDVDASDLLPTDDSSFGFDNIGSVLGVSPALIERYLLASGKVSRLAVGDPKIDPIVDTYRVRADLTQNEHIEGLPLGTRGGVLIQSRFSAGWRIRHQGEAAQVHRGSAVRRQRAGSIARNRVEWPARPDAQH